MCLGSSPTRETIDDERDDSTPPRTAALAAPAPERRRPTARAVRRPTARSQSATASATVPLSPRTETASVFDPRMATRPTDLALASAPVTVAAPDERDAERENDRLLVARLQKGDPAAFREIVRRHQDKVYRLALRLTRDDARAQDVVQDAFLQVFRKIGQFQEQSAFSTWLYRVTVNAGLMRLRTERRHHETSLEEASPRYTEAGEIADPIDDWSEAVDDEAINRELAGHAANAVDALPETYRSVFILRELEDLSTEEVANILELTVPTVKTRLHRARLALRKALADRVKGTDLETPARV